MYLQHLVLVVLITFNLTIVNGQINYGGSGANNDCCEDYCYQKDEDPYIYFATKTSYDSINRRSNGQQHIVPDCTPVQFWSLISHGTSLPKASRIRALRDLEKLQKEFRLNYEERRSYPDKGRLCMEDFILLKSWQWNASITEDRGNSLTAQGIDELKLLARRYKTKYSQILQSPYDERDFYFQYSMADRTHDSYQAYIEGMFGSEAYKVHANTMNEGQVLKTNVQCPNMNNEQFLSQSEYDRFMNNPEYQRMVHDVFTRLGFRFVLNASIINDMYDMCRYEKAWNVQQKSPWCIAFTKEHLKMLEYAEDLKYYYRNGYGSQMSTRIGCGAVKDFYERFQRTIDGNTEGNRGTFMFSNTATLQTVLTAMGVAKEFDRPTADNFYTQSRRKWRTSTLSPFAANLAAVLYQCRGEEKNRVMFFLNEIPLEFPDCSVGLCNWSTVKSKYENLVRTCNVDDPCSDSNAAAMSAYFSYYTILFLTSIAVLIRIY